VTSSNRSESEIDIEKWRKMPLEIRQALLMNIPQVWLVWHPYFKWPKWLADRWGMWIPRDVDINGLIK
jgi:hypothetical protein